MFAFIIITILLTNNIIEELAEKENHDSKWIEFKWIQSRVNSLEKKFQFISTTIY